MSKNGWIACIIVVVVLLCAGIFCLTLSLLGVASFIHISPTHGLNLPTLPAESGLPTFTPIVVRPSPQEPSSSPTSPSGSATPQIESFTSIPRSTSSPALVLTDTITSLENAFIPINDPIDLAHRLHGMEDLSPTQKNLH